jgi:hypothetical protein
MKSTTYISRNRNTVNSDDIAVELSDLDLSGRRANAACVICSNRFRRILERNALKHKLTVNQLLSNIIIRGISIER